MADDGVLSFSSIIQFCPLHKNDTIDTDFGEGSKTCVKILELFYGCSIHLVLHTLSRKYSHLNIDSFVEKVALTL